MSIKLEFSKGSMRVEAFIKDEAFTPLLEFIAKNETNAPAAFHQSTTPAPKPTAEAAQNLGPAAGAPIADTDHVAKVKQWLARHAASEVLNILKWNTHQEKILLLAAYHEASGGDEAWKSGDIQERFVQAKEPAPKNFARDLRSAVDSATIAAVTARTYRVGRMGWNKIGDAIATIAS